MLMSIYVKPDTDGEIGALANGSIRATRKTGFTRQSGKGPKSPLAVLINPLTKASLTDN
jgi:hypothetical protein